MARVRAFICALVLGAATLVGAAGADTPDGIAGFDRDPDWRTYVDPDRGTAVEYPAAVFSVEAGAPERGSGQEFRTQDGGARLVIYTLPNEERRSPRSYLERHLLLAPGALEYTRVTRHFFVISGARDAEIFYSRCFSRIGGAATCVAFFCNIRNAKPRRGMRSSRGSAFPCATNLSPPEWHRANESG